MTPNKNANLLRALTIQAETLSCTASKNEFPILLQPLATRRKVTSVDFCPLLTDAMLTTHPLGFRILFNSNGDDPLELSRQFASEDRDHLLPARLRFSLAHELAHTLFYDLANGTPKVAKQFRSGGGRTALENLERNCNKLAGHLLLPGPMLAGACRALKRIDADSILKLARRAGVSIEVLVRRLGEQNSVFGGRYFRGSIVLVKQCDGKAFIKAIAKPSQLGIARDLLLMEAGEHWQLASGSGDVIHPETLPPASTKELLMATAHGNMSTVPYRISIAKAGGFAGATSYLLVFEQIEM